MESSFSMNTLRVVLVGMTALAAVIALFLGQTSATLYLTGAVVVHGALWVHLARKRDAEHEQLHTGVEQYLRDEN